MKVYFLGSDKKTPALLGQGFWEEFFRICLVKE